MATMAQRGEPFTFYIRLSAIIRFFPLAATALFLYFLVSIPVSVGTRGFTNHPALWLLEIGFVGAVALQLWLAFPQRRTQARLEVLRESIKFIPRRMDRRFLGAQVTEVRVTARSSEILFCRSRFEGMPDGVRLIVRGSDEPERELEVKFSFILDAQDCRTIAEGIIAATGLPVRLVTRTRLMDGSIQETPWTPPEPNTNFTRGSVMAAIWAVPYIGGVIVGYVLPRPATIVIIGLVLWLGQMLAASACAHWLFHTREKYPTLYSLTTVFTFGAAYGLAVVFVGYIIRAR